MDDDCKEPLLGAHIAVDIIPDGKIPRWSHVRDLDTFFTKIYHYHQKHGYACIMAKEVLELVQLTLVLCFPTYLFYCIDYPVLFRDRIPKNLTKTVLSDAFLPHDECLVDMHLATWIIITIASIFWLLKLIKVFHHSVQCFNIKIFFNDGLKVPDSELCNSTWQDIQSKIIEIQKEDSICIHKPELTEFDIRNSIMRFKNYMIALINKSILPVHLNFPFLGDITFLTQGLRFNYELILLWGPWSPFKDNWHLRDDYRKAKERKKLAKSLSRHILCIGIINFILCPVIFLWQILYFVFSYGIILKKEPSVLGIREWTPYARLHLRHFNELDHEFNARLNKAYLPAVKYMNNFSSPLVNIIAKNFAFLFGAIFIVFLTSTLYHEDLLTIKQVFLIMSLTGCMAAVCRSVIPDENLVHCPETLLTLALEHIHYKPDSWKNQAHTQAVRAQMTQFFQYRAVHLIEELISPLLTPYILCFHLRHKALDIVDFFRNCTINVTGVGDVCSFTEMNLDKNTNPTWEYVVQRLSFISHVSGRDEEEETAEQNKVSEQQDVYDPIPDQYTRAGFEEIELPPIDHPPLDQEWESSYSAEPPAEDFLSALPPRNISLADPQWTMSREAKFFKFLRGTATSEAAGGVSFDATLFNSTHDYNSGLETKYNNGFFNK